VAIDQLTQEELLKSLNSDHITVAGKVYQGAWRIAKGTREALQLAIKNNTLLLSAVKQANALLDGKNIIYNPTFVMSPHIHIFCTSDSQVQARLHLIPV